MSVVNAIPMLLGGEGYEISRSVRFRSSATAYFTRTFGTPTNNLKWTMSMWMKRGTLNTFRALMAGNSGAGTSTNFALTFSAAGSNSDGDFFNYFTPNVGTRQFYSNAVYRDSSAWYHVVFVFDSANATQANRSILYINGVQQSGTNNVALNQICHWNESGKTGFLGYFGSSFAGDERDYFDGYLTEVNFVDGQALTPSSFGAFDSTGVWQPLGYTGTYGTNGFYLNFSDPSAATAAAIGKDSSGNGNNWTPNNISVTSGVTYDSMIDSPTMYADGGNGRGNYAIINPLKKPSTATITEGNLNVTWTTLGGEQPASFAQSSGKWYWEQTQSSTFAAPGIILDTAVPSASSIFQGYHYYGNNGLFYTATSGVSYGATFTTGDVIGVALDLDNNQITFYKNNTSQGTKTIVAGSYTPDFAAAGVVTINANFGQRPFTYTPPTGFKALNTQNLPAGSITTSGSFTGNASADGPFVYLNGVPTAMTINGNAVTFATHVDKTANGFKLRTSSSSYNASGSNTYSITTTGAKFKYANAQVNP